MLAPRFSLGRVAFVVALLAAPSGAAAQTASAPFSIESLDVAYRFEDDGTATHSVRARIRVSSEEGRRALGELYFPYRERTSRLELLALRTVKPTGDAIEAEPGRWFDVAPPSGRKSPVFSDLKYKAAPVPGLQVGDLIEYELLRTTFAPLAPGEFWGHHALTRNVPVGVERVELNLPANRTVAFSRDRGVKVSTERRDGRRIHRWTHHNPTPRDSEKGPYLFNVSTFRTWPELGAWMESLVAESAVSTPELEALARSLVDDAGDSREQVDRLVRYVTQQVRYVQVHLGIGSYQPHTASEVQRNLYGDCKDKHTLLAVLLEAVGIEARPALVHSTRTIDPRVPTPEAFDHMITRIDLDGEPLWVDATQQLAPAGWLAPRLRGDRALVVQASGAGLERLPVTTPIPDSRYALLRGTLAADGALDAELRVEHRGSFETGWRNLFHKGNEGEIETALKVDRPAHMKGATLGSPTASDPLDTSGPFVVEYALRQPDWLAPDESSARLPSMILGAFARSVPQGTQVEDPGVGLAYGEFIDRSTDLTLTDDGLGGPMVLEERIELKLPAELSIEPPPDVRDERDFATYTATYVVREGTLEATRTLEITTTRLTPSQHDDVRALVRAMRTDVGRNLKLTRTSR